MITSSFPPSERNVCRIGLLKRLALHTPYPAIAAEIIDIVHRLPRGHTTVIVDRTGAHAAYDMLVEKGLSPIGLTISGGDSVHWDGRYVTVPKMRLLTGLLSLCYRGELEISKRLRDYVEFRRQLQNIGTMATDAGIGETWRARLDGCLVPRKSGAPISQAANIFGARPACRFRIIVSPSILARASTIPSFSE